MTPLHAWMEPLWSPSTEDLRRGSRKGFKNFQAGLQEIESQSSIDLHAEAPRNLAVGGGPLVELAFSSQTTARLAGITLGQLTHWGLTDIALPSIDRGRKQGRPKKWSFSDVVGLRVIRELLSAGLSLQLVRRILPELRSFTGHSNNLQALAESRLVVLGNAEVAVVADAQTLVSLFPHRGQMIISSIVIELRPAIEDVQMGMLASGMQSEMEQLKEASAWVVGLAA